MTRSGAASWRRSSRAALAADAVTVEDAAGFARMGNAVASLCIRGRGGIPSMPAREDVMALLGV